MAHLRVKLMSISIVITLFNSMRLVDVITNEQTCKLFGNIPTLILFSSAPKANTTKYCIVLLDHKSTTVTRFSPQTWRVNVFVWVNVMCMHPRPTISYLSSGDGTDNLSSVGTHHLAKGSDDTTSQSQTTIISQNIWGQKTRV